MQDVPWLDRTEYPFSPHYLDLPVGRMHYVDEGAGKPLLMVHGTPQWSFAFRKLIKQLSAGYRCIAPDLIGFGLSSKPRNWSYLPQAHAAQVRSLIEHLGLRDLALVLHDFGGPIGLSYALDQPDNVGQIIVFNSWCWSLAEDSHFALASRVLGSPVGRLLYKRFNFSVRVMMRLAAGEPGELPAGAHAQYLAALPTPADRHGTWVFARELAGSSAWYDSLWERRRLLTHKPALILWGMRDSAFRPQELARWLDFFPLARIERFTTAGHFLAEGKGEECASLIEAFLESSTGNIES
ncbi:MAG: alpha/beta fold hydrolase [Chloroflexota bacterium]